jgi:hypothetical protein
VIRGSCARAGRAAAGLKAAKRVALLVSVDDLLGNPARYAEAKSRASAPVKSGSCGLKISDPRSIIRTDRTNFRI